MKWEPNVNLQNSLISAVGMVVINLIVHVSYILGYVRSEVSTAVTMKNGVFWYVTSCGSCRNRLFGERSASIIRATRIGELGTKLAVTSYNARPRPGPDNIKRNKFSALHYVAPYLVSSRGVHIVDTP
jgi:hypothetical protein